MISVIVPVYNKAPFLRRCLDSLVNQTDKSAQVIVVDDGSTDGSSKICNSYKKYGFEVYRQSNRGVSVARNVGLEKVKGEYVTFLDADDAYTPDAVDVMTRITRHNHNIYQFGQYRCHPSSRFKDHICKGHYSPDELPRRWTMVWNKLYKKSFIDSREVRFIEDMQFGEDEVFNAQLLLANNGLYHAPQTLILHYFDDKKSLCRGELNVARLQKLLDTLKYLGNNERTQKNRNWYYKKIEVHKGSTLFRKFGFNRTPTGKYDIVYFLKDTKFNEELRYSLRSVEANWQYNRAWFYGGCPKGLVPDRHIGLEQKEKSKWERVRGMMIEACRNDELTEDFWLFNDDFFIMKPISEDMPPQYNGTLDEQIERVERRHGGDKTDYTKRLRHLVKTLSDANKSQLNYSVHKPMLINRKKMLEVLEKFPDEPMQRALYGNYWEVGGVDKHDMKIAVMSYNINKIKKWEFLSSADDSFKCGNVGEYIRKKFTEKSRFEE